MVYSFQPPGGRRVDSTRFFRGDNFTSVSATDGGAAWRQETGPKPARPTDLGGMDKDLLLLDARLPFLFLDAESPGDLFKYIGETGFAGKKAYVVHAWLKGGLQIEILFDQKSFHIINYRQPLPIAGRPVLVDRVPTGLFRLDGVWWESGYRWELRGKTARSLEFRKERARSGALDPRSLEKPQVAERWLRKP